MRMRTAIAIGCALVLSAGCGGEVTAVPQRAKNNGGSGAAPAAAQGMGSGVAGVRDGQSDAALEAPRQDSAAALICAADASAGIIQPSDYDQSCAFDSDCVEVHATSACSCDLFCVEPPQAINKGTLPQYTADFAKLPRLLCNCTNPLPPCDADEPFGPHCVGGMCQIASPCSD